MQTLIAVMAALSVGEKLTDKYVGP